MRLVFGRMVEVDKYGLGDKFKGSKHACIALGMWENGGCVLGEYAAWVCVGAGFWLTRGEEKEKSTCVGFY